MAEAKRAINTWAGRLPIAMSVAAVLLLMVVFATGWERGYKDEGAAAHSWQLLVGLQVPLIMVFLATADWTRSRRVFAVLALQALGLVLAMAPVAIAGL